MGGLCVLPIESTKTAMTQAEKDEFLAAYKDVHAPLMRFCMVKSRGIMDAKDLANDVLLVGLENYSNLTEKKALLSYLFTTANRICLNKLRRRKFEGTFNEKAVNKLEEDSSDASEKVDVSFLYEALEQLPELQKEAVILFEISDLPIKEIMTIQNSGESAVKQRIKRGKEKLAMLLGEKEKRKLAVLIPLFITSQSVGMTHIDLYFQAFKSLPLPLSSAEASATIGSFTAGGAAIHPAANKLGTTLLKKIGLGIFIAAAGVSTTLLLMSPSETQQQVTANKEDQASDQKTSFLSTPMQNNERETSVFYVVNAPRLEEAPQAPFEADTVQENEVLPGPNQSLKNEQKASENSGIALSGDLFSLEGIAAVRIDNMGDHVEVKTWDRNEVKIIPKYIVEAKSPEEEALIRKHLDFKVVQNGSTLILSSNFCNVSRTTSGFGRNQLNTIQFDRGKKIKYKVIEASYTIMMPATKNLDINGHYKTVSIPDVDADLKINLHETKFNCGSVTGNATVSLHYSEATTGDFNRLELGAFESEIALKDVKTIGVEAKYSTISAASISGSKIELFETKLNAQKFTGALEANLKYSTLNFTNSALSASKIIGFESKINIPSFSDLSVDLRYSTLTSQTIEDLIISVGFESKFYLGSVKTIDAQSSKYCTYTVSNLDGKITMESFEDRLTIARSSMAAMKFEGKYSTYTITLAQPSNYQFKLNGNYCKVNYLAHPLKVSRLEETNEHKILEGFFGGADGSSPLISFDCFESTINLF